MKKLILTASVFLIGGAVATAQSAENTKYGKVETKNDVVKPHTGKKPVHSSVKPKATVLWSNEFDDENDWVIDNSSSIHDAWVFTSAPYSQSIQGGTGFTTLESSTNNNGYAIIDSDGAYAGDGNGQLVGTLTNVTPIDLQGEPDVLLIFEHNYRWWNDSRGVRVSGDNGTTWTTFEITDAAGYPGDQSSANPEIEIIDISSVAGNQEEVLIEFYYDDNNFWGWYWAIDDVEIIRKPENDVATTTHYFGTAGLAYYQIPEAQIAPIDVTVKVENRGINAQTGVALDVEETIGGTFTAQSQTVTLAPNDEDSLIMNPQFTPSGIGSYNLAFELLNDETDEIPSNNEMNDYAFDVTQHIYARDRDNATGSYAPEVAFEVGNLFDIFASASLTGVQAQFGAIVAEGAEVVGTLYLIDAGEFQFQAETEVYMASASDAGEVVNIKFPSAITLNAGATYLLTCGSTFDEFSIGVSGSSPTQTSFVYGDVGANGLDWYFTTSTPMVRMNFDPSLNTIENELAATDVVLFPNPAKEIATLEFNLENAAQYQLQVTDVTGKNVFSTASEANSGVNQIAIPTGHLTEGIYIYKLVLNGSIISNKFVVSK